MVDKWMKVGDTLPEVTATLQATQEDGTTAAVNIFGAYVEFVVRPIRGGDVIVHADATNLDDNTPANRGKVMYTWQVGDTDTPGGYSVEWRVTYAGGDVETFPNDGYRTLAIADNLPVVGS